MARQATGTIELRSTSYYARFTKPDGSRKWVRLETLNPIEAKSLTKAIADAIAAGTYTWDDAPKPKPAVLSVRDYADRFLARKKDKTAKDYRGVLERYALPSLGSIPLATVTKVMVRDLFERLADRGLSALTIRTVRMILSQLFSSAVEDELIATSPITKGVKVPERAEVDTRPFIVPTDDELQAVAESDAVKSLEIKILALASRTEGGMRTGDLVTWTWEMIDTADFAACTVPREKTRHKRPPQRLAIPDVLRPWLRAWWEAQGTPASGPVFPRVKGRKRGEARASRGTSFAGPLRCALFAAGVRRHTCSGKAPKDGRTPDGIKPCCAAFARDELYNDTPNTRRANFHSLRRSFATSLAEAGVNVQQAMILTGHQDPSVHMRYAASTMAHVPAAALPAIRPPVASNRPPTVGNSSLAGSVAESPAVANSNDSEGFYERRGSDSNRRMTVLQTVA